MKKIVISIFFAALFALLIPSAARADSNTAGAVIIDTPWTTLETSVEALAGISGPTDVTSLTIIAADTLDGADIAYIDSMTSLILLYTSSSVYYDANGDLSFGDVGNGFLANNTAIVSITMINAVSFGASTFAECDSLLSITLPNATTFVGLCRSCDNLPYASLPNAVTFSASAFQDCGNLTSVDLPNAESFGSFSFEGSGLISVSLPSATTFGDSVFGASPNLVSIDLPSAVTFAYRPIYECDSITTISIPNATTFGDYAFALCPLLTTINLPSAETFGDRTFYGCTALAEVNLPSAVSFGTETFMGCTQPIDLTLGTNIPMVGSFGASIPASGSGLYVPTGMVTPYDSDLSGGPGEALGDLLWYNWPLQITPAVNPQTENRTSIIPVLLFILLAIIIFAVIIILVITARKKASS